MFKKTKKGEFSPQWMISIAVGMVMLFIISSVGAATGLRITEKQINNAKDDATSAAQNTALDNIATAARDSAEETAELPTYIIGLIALIVLVSVLGGFYMSGGGPM